MSCLFWGAGGFKAVIGRLYKFENQLSAFQRCAVVRRVYMYTVVDSFTGLTDLNYVLYIYINTHFIKIYLRSQKQCERLGGLTGLPVPNSPCGLCGCNTTLTCMKYDTTDSVYS